MHRLLTELFQVLLWKRAGDCDVRGSLLDAKW